MADTNKNDSSAGRSVAIPCPNCSSRAKVPVSKISSKGLIYSCPRCKTKILASRDGNKVSVRRATEAEIAERAEEEDAKKKKEPEVEIIEGAPSWVVTFADLATLLLTFFVLMLSFANMDIVKFKELVGSVQNRYGVTLMERGGYQAVSVGKLMEVDSNLKETAEAVAREQLVNVIYDEVVREGFRNAASITSTDEGVRVRVKGRVLFEPGGSKLNPEGLRLLKGIMTLLTNMKDIFLVVEGHTDNRPIRTAKYPSNWELSVMRASAVLEYLVSQGAPPERLSAAGYADTMPLFSNDREETRVLNRRVEFLFKRI